MIKWVIFALQKRKKAMMSSVFFFAVPWHADSRSRKQPDSDSQAKTWTTARSTGLLTVAFMCHISWTSNEWSSTPDCRCQRHWRGWGSGGHLVKLNHVALPSLPQVSKGPFFKASQDESHQGECRHTQTSHLVGVGGETLPNEDPKWNK